MFSGWWITFVFSGLSLSIGVVVWILWRDRERRFREKEEKAWRIVREVRGGLDAPAPTVRDLEEEFLEGASLEAKAGPAADGPPSEEKAAAPPRDS